MNYAISEIQPIKTLSTSADTLTVDIKTKQPISALMFEYKVTMTGGAMTDHPAGNITNIKLIDGSTTLFSLSGREMHAMGWYDKATPQYAMISNKVGVMSMLGIVYNFGRKLWDPDLAFDAKRFSNPQLVIAYDPIKCDASSTVHTLRIVALAFDDKAISPSGFLACERVYSYTCGTAGSIQLIQLPVTYPIRKLLIRGYYASGMPYQVANHVKIQEDQTGKTPLDMDVSAYQKLVMGDYPPYIEHAQLQLTNSNAAIYATPAYDIDIHAVQISGTTPAIISNFPQYEPIYIQGAAATPAVATILGRQPHACIAVPFGDQMDMADWYDVTKLGSLALSITAGSAAANGAVQVISQMRRSY